MREQDADGEEEPLTAWEQLVADSLVDAGLPMWDYKAKAATFAQGHRGLLDLDLEFPCEYLKGPAPLSYVWKLAVDDGVRVHVYADIDGGRCHLEWEEETEDGPQNQPLHVSGSCGSAGCEPCEAAEHLSAQLPNRNPLHS